MSRITLEIPDDSLLALKMTEDEVGEALRLAAAIKLFELRRLSSGAAARLAGLPKVAFLARLADYGVAALDWGEEDFRRETRLV
jgi:predicted HTH domain antitoxin